RARGREREVREPRLRAPRPPGAAGDREHERERLTAGAARRCDRGADRPRRPRDPDALARDALQWTLPRRAIAGEPPGPARRPLEMELDGPRARSAQRDDTPSPERAAVDVRLAALER